MTKKTRIGDDKMTLLYVILGTLFFYYVALVMVTKEKFSQRNMNASLGLLLVVPLYINYIHFKIANGNRRNKPMLKVIFKSVTIDYNVAVVILAEVMLFYAKQERAQSTSNNVMRQNIVKLNKDSGSFNAAISEQLAAA